MVDIYCGNNSQDTGLVTGTKVLGTRYRCLQKGIGKGLNMPYDDKYLGAYAPIDNTRIYCGNLTVLPAGYDRFGTITECLQKGIGVGKKLKAERGPSRFRYMYPIVIFLLLELFLFLWLYNVKPNIILDTRIEEIDWEKFWMVFVQISMMFAIIVFLFWKYYLRFRV